MIANRFLHCIFILFMALFLYASLASLGHAEITLDGTLGPGGPLSGPDFMIPAEVGGQVGGNLFHSFGRFNVNTGESATFNGPNSVKNIIGRVTGGSSSTINGLLRSEIPGADLFLINPAGIMFGPNAQLDVQGSFHAGTADFVSLGENGRFDAVEPDKSLLTVAPPSAFGFLGENPAGIFVREADLEVPKGKTLSLIGGDIEIIGGRLAAPSGQINIASVSTQGKLVLDTSNLGMDSFEELGEIDISQGANIDVSGGGGEGIFIRGGVFALSEDSVINSSNISADPGGDISITTTDSVSISGGSVVGSTTFDHGNAGNISISAPTLKIESMDENAQRQSGLITSTIGDGNAGDIELKINESIEISGNSRIFTSTAAAGSLLGLSPNKGNAGKILIETGGLNLRDGATIDSSSFLSEGVGGNISIKANESVTISGHPIMGVSSCISARSNGSGKSGNIEIFAPALKIEDGCQISTTTVGDGNAGQITLDVGTIELTNGAQLTSESGFQDALGNVFLGTGQAGNITVTATDAASLSGWSKITTSTMGDGNAGQITLNSKSLELSQSSGIYNTSGSVDAMGNIMAGTGRAGDITITVDDVITLSSGTWISNATVKGDGGTVSVTTPSILKMDGSAIAATTMGDGNAGDITLDVGTIELTNGALISSDSGFQHASGNVIVGTGQGGKITVTATDKASLSIYSKITTSTKGIGMGGELTIEAKEINLLNESTISASSSSKNLSELLKQNSDAGKSGNIFIQADDTIRLQNGSSITVETNEANAGDIIVNAGFLMHLRDESAISTSVAGGKGNGGNILIDPVFVVLDGASKIVANAIEGGGGDIYIHIVDDGAFLKSPDSIVDASSKFGVSGSVRIDAPDTDISGSISTLPVSFLDVSSLLSERCVTRTAGELSTFNILGHGGMPLSPDTPLPAFYLLDKPKDQ